MKDTITIPSPQEVWGKPELVPAWPSASDPASKEQTERALAAAEARLEKAHLRDIESITARITVLRGYLWRLENEEVADTKRRTDRKADAAKRVVAEFTSEMERLHAELPALVKGAAFCPSSSSTGSIAACSTITTCCACKRN